LSTTLMSAGDWQYSLLLVATIPAELLPEHLFPLYPLPALAECYPFSDEKGVWLENWFRGWGCRTANLDNRTQERTRLERWVLYGIVQGNRQAEWMVLWGIARSERERVRTEVWLLETTAGSRDSGGKIWFRTGRWVVLVGETETRISEQRVSARNEWILQRRDRKPLGSWKSKSLDLIESRVNPLEVSNSNSRRGPRSRF
jgi:hypothetical protein